jgi:hypothetical protein
MGRVAETVGDQPEDRLVRELLYLGAPVAWLEP